jgi:hypothetical protein
MTFLLIGVILITLAHEKKFKNFEIRELPGRHLLLTESVTCQVTIGTILVTSENADGIEHLRLLPTCFQGADFGHKI